MCPTVTLMLQNKVVNRKIFHMIVCLHWPRPRLKQRLIPVPMELGLMIMFCSGYTGPRPRPMQISIGSVHTVSASVSVSGIVNDDRRNTQMICNIYNFFLNLYRSCNRKC